MYTITQVVSYCVYPANVGADFGEDGWLLEDIAACTRAEAHRSMDVPGSIGVLAVQGTPRVSLQGTHTWLGEGEAFAGGPSGRPGDVIRELGFLQ